MTGKHGEKIARFEITAPADRAVFYIVDADTGIVIHDAEVKKRGSWAKLGGAWCAKPEYPRLAPGRSREIRVAVPETKLPWRIGIRLYDGKPAANVRSTQVWSTAVE